MEKDKTEPSLLPQGPFCIDCKHFRKRDERCLASPKFDRVLGTFSFWGCYAERADNSAGSCGPEGRKWAPIEKT